MQPSKSHEMEEFLPPSHSQGLQPSSSPVLKSQEAEALRDEPIVNGLLQNCIKSSQHCSTVKILRTLGCYGSFFTIGLLVSYIAVCLVELEEATHSTTVQMALLFTWSNIGRLPGTLFCGFIFDRFNKELQLGGGLFLLGVTGAIIPVCTSYYILATTTGFAGAAVGFLGTGCTCMIISIWSNVAYLQGLHLSISIGSMVGPLIVEAFQVQRTNLNSNITSPNFTPYTFSNDSKRDSNASTHLDPTSREYDAHPQVPGETLGGNSSFIEDPIKKSFDIQLIGPFIIYVVIVLVFISIFIALWIKSITEGNSTRPTTRKESQVEADRNHVKLRIALMTTFILLIFAQGAFEATYGGLLVQYTYKYLKMSRPMTKMVSASFWVGMTSGRVLGLFIGNVGHLNLQIAVHLMIGITAMSLLSGLATVHISIVWLSSILAGLTISTTVANTFMLAQRALNLRSRSTSLLVFSLYGGMTVGPAGTGKCFDWFGVRVFPGINLGFTLFMGVSFLFILMLKKKVQ